MISFSQPNNFKHSTSLSSMASSSDTSSESSRDLRRRVDDIEARKYAGYAITSSLYKVELVLIRNSLVSTDVVTIRFGSKTYHLAKGLMCKMIPFFESAFCRGFAESKSNEMLLSLTEIDVPAFEILITWVYRGPDGLYYHNLDASPLRDYVRLYFLADMWCLDELMGLVLDLLDGTFRALCATNCLLEYLNSVESTLTSCWNEICDRSESKKILRLKRWLLDWTTELIHACKQLSTAGWVGTLSGMCIQQPSFAVALLVHDCSRDSKGDRLRQVVLLTDDQRYYLKEQLQRKGMEAKVRSFLRLGNYGAVRDDCKPPGRHALLMYPEWKVQIFI